ncbi:MAG: class I adenylate-forming enzyme family protein [Gammaproteobacteria bacterium]
MADFFLKLKKNAERYPASPAIASRTGQLSYRFVVRSIEAVAANAVAAGIGPRQTILVNCSNSEAWLPLIFGLMRTGATVGVVPSPATFVEHNVRIDAVVTDKPDLKVPCRVIHLTPQWFNAPSTRMPVAGTAKGYSLIFSSSGSTGKKKLIKFSSENVDYSIKMKIGDDLFSGCPRYYSTSGDMTFPTFVDFMITLMRGGLIIQNRDRRTIAILDTIGLFRPTHISMAPGTLAMIIDSLREQPRQFEKVDYVRLSGAYCAVETREKAAEIFAKNIVMGYGATEIGRVASGELADMRNMEGLVGWIIDGLTTVETVDDDDRPLPAGIEGEIRIKPPKAAVASYATGLGDQSVLRDGWFYPGDIGRVGSDRGLIITGRKSLVMNLGGTKINPEIAEAALRKMEAVEDVGVLAVRDRDGFDVACAAIVKKKSVDLDEINRHLFDEGCRFTVSKLKFVSSIPRTENGKVDRMGLKKLVGREAVHG